MKNLFYSVSLLFIGVVSFSSCSSDDYSPAGNGGEVAKAQVVTLNVSGEFTESTTSMRSVPASDYQLRYIVHNKTTGALVKIREIEKGVTTVTDTLALGEYKVSLLATASENYSSIVLRPRDLVNYNTALADINSAGEYDVFYGTFDMQVGALPVADQMTLLRIVGKIEVFVEDAASIPANIEYLQLAIGKNLPSGFRLLDEQTIFEDMGENGRLAVTKEMSRQDFLSKQGAQFQLYLLDYSPEYNTIGSTSDLYVTLYDGLYWEGHTRTYLPIKKDLAAKRNQVIKLSGKLFDKNMSLGNIQINNTWNEEINQKFD